MSMNSAIDYWGCILVKFCGFIIRRLPLNTSAFLGRRIGDLMYLLDLKHRSIAYANLKTAFGSKLSLSDLRNITRNFYRNFGQNLIDIFLVPLVDKDFIKKNIIIENKEYISQSFSRSKGVIFLGVHEGSWEFSNVIGANLFSYHILIRPQPKYPRLETLLNSYRIQKGCNLITRGNQTKRLIEALKNNHAVGMTFDQGGKSGELIDFFGKPASFATGAIRLALRYGATIIPGFFLRTQATKIKIIFHPPLQLKESGNFEKDVRDSLSMLVGIFEKFITDYPHEYLWTHKIWKYANRKNILVLSDGKTGHLRQSESLAHSLKKYLGRQGIAASVGQIRVVFKKNPAKFCFNTASLLSGKYACQGCLLCFKNFLDKACYEKLVSVNADAVISCGFSLAALNFMLSRQSLAKSCVIMRPGLLSAKNFDLVIMSRHDRPAKAKNVVVTDGALNSMDEEYLASCVQQIIPYINKNEQETIQKQLYVGLLIGGDSKNFQLKPQLLCRVLRQIKLFAQKAQAGILITTSRRTSPEAEKLIKQELAGSNLCKLLIIANEKNIPNAVGGILGLSSIVVTSPESISMISEAVSSNKYVLVFDVEGLSKKHRRFLDYFSKNNYLNLVKEDQICSALERIWTEKPKMQTLNDNFRIEEGLKRLL